MASTDRPRKQLWDQFKLINLQNLLITLTVVLVLLFLGGILQLVYFGWPYNQYLSWSANDLPSIRAGAIKIQMNFGVHYFGDFLQPLDWAKQANPWTSDPKYLAQYPPLAVYVLKPLTIVPYRVAACIYLLLMLSSSIFGIWLTSKALNWNNRILITLIFGVCSVPFLMAFDRGNLVGFFVLLFALFVYGVKSESKAITWLSLGIMIAIKIYPVLLILVLLKLRRFKELFIALLFAFGVTVALFALTPGTFTETIQQFLSANIGGLDIQADRQIRTFANLIHLFIDAPDAILQSWKYARDANVIFNLFRISLLAVSVLMIALKPKMKLSGLILLSCIAMTTLNSSQLGYNWFWAPVFVVWLISERSIKVGDSDFFESSEVWKTERYAVIAALGFCLLSLPIGLHVPGSTTPLTPYIGLLTCFIAMISLVFEKSKIIPLPRKHLSVH